VVMAVLEDAREFQETFATLKDLSAVDRIFRALSITFAYHVQDPEFYRTLWASLLDLRGGDAGLRDELITPRNSQFWRGLLEEARCEGAIAEDIDLDLLQQALDGQFAAVMLKWIMGGSSVYELEPSACFSYAATFCAFASDSFRAEIRRRMLGFQSQLLAVRQAQTDSQLPRYVSSNNAPL